MWSFSRRGHTALHSPLSLCDFRLQQLRTWARHVGLMSVVIGSVCLARSAVAAWAQGTPAALALAELVHVAMYPAMACLPYAAAFVQKAAWIKPACMLSHVVRSLCMLCAGLGLAPMTTSLKVVTERQHELVLDIPLAFQDQLPLPTMALLYLLRQAAWMSVVVYQLHDDVTRAVWRGVGNWVVMMLLASFFEACLQAAYHRTCQQLSHPTSTPRAGSDADAVNSTLPNAFKGDDPSRTAHTVEPVSVTSTNSTSLRQRTTNTTVGACTSSDAASFMSTSQTVERSKARTRAGNSMAEEAADKCGQSGKCDVFGCHTEEDSARRLCTLTMCDSVSEAQALKLFGPIDEERTEDVPAAAAAEYDVAPEAALTAHDAPAGDSPEPVSRVPVRAASPGESVAGSESPTATAFIAVASPQATLLTQVERSNIPLVAAQLAQGLTQQHLLLRRGSYTRRHALAKVHVKLHGLELEDMSPDLPTMINSSVTQCVPGTALAGLALRSGCVLMSLDLACGEGLELTEGLRHLLTTLVRQHTTDTNTVMSDGTLATVQVDGQTVVLQWQGDSAGYQPLANTTALPDVAGSGGFSLLAVSPVVLTLAGGSSSHLELTAEVLLPATCQLLSINSPEAATATEDVSAKLLVRHMFGAYINTEVTVLSTRLWDERGSKTAGVKVTVLAPGMSSATTIPLQLELWCATHGASKLEWMMSYVPVLVLPDQWQAAARELRQHIPQLPGQATLRAGIPPVSSHLPQRSLTASTGHVADTASIHVLHSFDSVSRRLPGDFLWPDRDPNAPITSRRAVSACAPSSSSTTESDLLPQLQGFSFSGNSTTPITGTAAAAPSTTGMLASLFPVHCVAGPEATPHTASSRMPPAATQVQSSSVLVAGAQTSGVLGPTSWVQCAELPAAAASIVASALPETSPAAAAATLAVVRPVVNPVGPDTGAAGASSGAQEEDSLRAPQTQGHRRARLMDTAEELHGILSPAAAAAPPIAPSTASTPATSTDLHALRLAQDTAAEVAVVLQGLSEFLEDLGMLFVIHNKGSGAEPAGSGSDSVRGVDLTEALGGVNITEMTDQLLAYVEDHGMTAMAAVMLGVTQPGHGQTAVDGGEAVTGGVAADGSFERKLSTSCTMTGPDCSQDAATPNSGVHVGNTSSALSEWAQAPQGPSPTPASTATATITTATTPTVSPTPNPSWWQWVTEVRTLSSDPAYQAWSAEQTSTLATWGCGVLLAIGAAALLRSYVQGVMEYEGKVHLMHNIAYASIVVPQLLKWNTSLGLLQVLMLLASVVHGLAYLVAASMAPDSTRVWAHIAATHQDSLFWFMCALIDTSPFPILLVVKAFLAYCHSQALYRLGVASPALRAVTVHTCAVLMMLVRRLRQMRIYQQRRPAPVVPKGQPATSRML